ncbi:MAG: molecular chaperone TorD family protein [Coriobacteriales bacterium]|jgi:TorA maturation chaperone TorD|nr:molecular chaperone TorD family protein [Coriobacteriales bacterium]
MSKTQEQQWINRAALYEILALSFLLTRRELAQALVNGEYAEACAEIASANGLDAQMIAQVVDELAIYQGREADEVFHELRQEYTHLFIGAPRPVISPFAGIWYAEEIGVEPLLFVNKKSMAIERFMRCCGVGQPAKTNDPLDHIGSMLEFLQYLSLLRAEVLVPPEDIEIPANAYEDFYGEHFIDFAHTFAAATIRGSRMPFFAAMARVLGGCKPLGHE